MEMEILYCGVITSRVQPQASDMHFCLIHGNINNGQENSNIYLSSMQFKIMEAKMI
jgi:hypothetical protein